MPKMTTEELKGLVPIGFRVDIAETAGFLYPRVDDAAIMFDRTFGDNADRYNIKVTYDGRDVFWIDGEGGADDVSIRCNTLEDVMNELCVIRDKRSLSSKWALELIHQLENTKLQLHTASEILRYAFRLRTKLERHVESICQRGIHD